MSRYSANKRKFNPHNTPVIEDLESETNNEVFFERAKAIFSVEQINAFKAVDSYKKFLQYCIDNDIKVVL